MRLAKRLQTVWMYGFPTRKHHYDRSFSRNRQTSLDRYSAVGNSITGDVKFTDGYSVFANHSPVKTNYNINKAFSNGITHTHKSLEQTPDSGGRLLSRKNYFINFDNDDNSTGYRAERDYIVSDDESYYQRRRSRNKDHTIENYYRFNNTREDCHEQVNEPGTYYTNTYRENRWEHSNLIEDMKYTPKAQIVEPLDVVALPPAKARFDIVKIRNNNNNIHHRNNNSTRNSYTSTEETAYNKLHRQINKSDHPESDHVDEDVIIKCSTSEDILKAIKEEDIYAAINLLENKSQDVDINVTDKSGKTILSHAVLKASVPLVEKLLKIPKINVNKADNEGNTPLHFAVQAGQVEIVSLLLNSSSNLEIDARNHLGLTPLMKAALQGRTKCAKILIFAGASPTMRDTGRGLRAEQWARFCGRYICADVIEKYARSQLLSKSTSYGNWGNEPEMGLHFVNGKLQPPAVALQNALAKNHQQNNGFKSKLRRALQSTRSNNGTKINSFSLVSQLTSAALCVSSPVLPNSSHIPPVVKSILKPFVIPRIEITSDECDSSESVSISSDGQDQQRQQETSRDSDGTNSTTSSKSGHKKFSNLVRLRKKR